MAEKLIRDRVPVDSSRVRFALDSEREALLMAKLEEEAAELRSAAPTDALEELADLYEVVSALATEHGYDMDDVRSQADRKEARLGAFTRWLVWDMGPEGAEIAKAQRHGVVRLNALDGPRERRFPVPDNWEKLTEEQREAVWRPVKEQLMEDTVDFAVVEPGHVRMTVGELRAALAEFPDDVPVVVQNHRDDMESSPLHEVEVAVWVPTVNGRGERSPLRTTPEAVRSVFLVPLT